MRCRAVLGFAFIWGFCAVGIGGAQEQGPASPGGKGEARWTLQGAMPGADEQKLLEASLAAGADRIEKFFGKPFPKPFAVEVFPSRGQFDAYFTRRWKVPKTQPWMVASGVGDKLTILSRDVWKTQAAEHDPRDEAHYRELIAHELVHVYHGQLNPTGDFEGMDDLGWFVEGLAVYVSGQLEQSHKHGAAKALEAGKVPKALAQAWSGRHRYGVCGSMAQFIDQKWGRAALIDLLPAAKPEQLLQRLKVTESEFLKAWLAFVKGQPSPP